VERVGKALSISVEYQSGDPRFDEAVYVHHNGMPELYLNTLLRDQAAREAIVSLLGTSPQQLSLSYDGASVSASVCWPQRLSNPTTGEELKQVADQLAAIVNATPPVRLMSLERGIPASKIALFTMFPLVILSFFISMQAGMRWLIITDVWRAPWLISAALWLVVSASLVWVFRGHSRSFHHVSLMSLCLILVVPSLALPTLKAINASHEPSRHELRRAHVTEHYVQRGSKGA
jgi:hypothetical protein